MTCSQCGECCKYINLGRATLYTADQKEYIREHGATETDGFFLLYHPCPHLITYDNGPGCNLGVHRGFNEPEEHRTYCDIHDRKPKLCRQFNGKSRKNGTRYWVPACCTMKVK